MTYTALLDEEGIKANYLVVMKPARVETGWALVSATVYKKDFSLGHAIAVSIDGVAQTEVFTTPDPNEFWYDYENEELYINTSSPSTKTVIVTYEIYVSTIGTHWHRIPTDDTSRTVYYEPLIIKPPSFKASLSDSLFGFLPSQSSNIVIGNPEHVFEEHLYASSFNKKTIDVYHWLDDLLVENMKLVISALGGNIDYSTDRFSIRLLDRIDLFNQEFRNTTTSFYSSSTFPNIDSNMIGRPIRFVAGVVDSILMTNLDYNDEAPTTSNNRIWGVRIGALNNVSQTVSTTPASTTTRTYLDSTSGLLVGDGVWIDKTTDEYRIITAVNRTGSEYIEHAALASGAAAAADTVKRGTVSWIGVEQGGVQYKAFYNRDYTESVSNGVVVITFNSSMESNVGITTLTALEALYCRVYGEVNAATIVGSPFGSDSTVFSSLTNPAVLLYNVLKDHLGLTEAEINTSSFQSLSTDIGDEDIGFSAPQNITGDFPLYKNIISDIMKSNLIQLFLDNDNKWEVSVIKPLTTEDKSIQEDEILDKSIRYTLKYNDILSDVLVSYNYKEFSNESNKVSQHSDLAEWLHEISKQKTFSTYLLESTDATDLARRLGFIFGDRQGTLTISSKNRFFDSKISDIINVELKKLLGFAYDGSTLNSRKFDILQLDKGLRRVNMTLTDQKGIEDNSAAY